MNKGHLQRKWKDEKLYHHMAYLSTGILLRIKITSQQCDGWKKRGTSVVSSSQHRLSANIYIIHHKASALDEVANDHTWDPPFIPPNSE